MDDWWTPSLRTMYAGRDVVLVGEMASSWATYAERLRQFGAQRLLVLATNGPGAGPAPVDAEVHTLRPPDGLSLMELVRLGHDRVANPPDEFVEAVERFDPDRRAIVSGSFLSPVTEFVGRPLFAARRPEWVALEDKTVIDRFWDRADIERQPSEVVEVGAATAAARRLDRGAGTVWAADAREGFHGGASHTHLVVDDDSRQRALSDLTAVSDRVRVMPFITGVPCSIHGIVLADGVAVLRPVEMVVLRRSGQLFFCGSATFWDPPDRVRDQMRSVARRVAARLIDEVEFRGTFTVDGVAADDGFWPTELNPRFGGGIMAIANGIADLPLLMVHELAAAGLPIGTDAQGFEEQLVSLADAHRWGRTLSMGAGTTDEVSNRLAVFDGKAWGWAESADAHADGRVVAGNGFVRCEFSPDTTPIGPSVAERAAAFWRFADAELDAGIGPVSVA